VTPGLEMYDIFSPCPYPHTKGGVLPAFSCPPKSDIFKYFAIIYEAIVSLHLANI
jgi:hypothetical protein